MNETLILITTICIMHDFNFNFNMNEGLGTDLLFCVTNVMFDINFKYFYG